MPFDRPILDARRAILRAVWQRVQPYLAATTTFTVWSARNSRIALDFARLGWTPERVVTAWELASEDEPVRELRIVQAFTERVHATVTAQRMAAQA